MRWSGKIGYSVTVEDPIDSGVYKEQITERSYHGDIISSRLSYKNANQVNDDAIWSNQFSVVADRFAISHFHEAKYITFNGVKWKISNIEMQPPRLTINVSDVYNAGGGPAYEQTT